MRHTSRGLLLFLALLPCGLLAGGCSSYLKLGLMQVYYYIYIVY